MKSYGSMLLVAMPIFLLLIFVEQLWGWFRLKEKPKVIDTIAGISSGMTNILKSTLGLTVILISYPWFLEHIAIFHWKEGSIWPYVITFVFIDFVGYWEHRLNHTVNFFWNHHIVHHSSEEFNLPCALRQQISIFTNILALSVVPLAIIGISPGVLALIGPIQLFAQFWYHTRYIGKMGFLESFLVTPSHHRVHHAMNDVYMDKNYGQIFIFWDRMFGTFQEERADVEPVYGMRRPAQTWNPYVINFKHLWLLIKDAWRTKSWKDKLRIWFMPTGWRPADVAGLFPVFTLTKMEELKKFDPQYTTQFVGFSIFHATVIFSLLCFLFSRFGEISRAEMLLNGVFLLFAIFAFTSFLDKKAYGFYSMLVTAVMVSCEVFVTRDWFGMNLVFPGGAALVAIYFVISGLAAAWLFGQEGIQVAANPSHA